MMNPEKPTPLKDELAVRRAVKQEQLMRMGVLVCNLDSSELAPVIPFPIKPEPPRRIA